jgi:hypothetical protein
MHKHLESLNQFFTDKTSTFVTIINSHPGQYTHDDHLQFAELIEEIRNEALLKITDFFKEKHKTKTELYDSQVLLPLFRSPCLVNQDKMSQNNCSSSGKN